MLGTMLDLRSELSETLTLFGKLPVEEVSDLLLAFTFPVLCLFWIRDLTSEGLVTFWMTTFVGETFRLIVGLETSLEFFFESFF